MQINHSNFAQTYQAIKQAQVINEKTMTISAEQKNQWQQARNESAQQKRAIAVHVVDYKQTQNNLDSYIRSFQDSVESSSATTSNLTYRDINDINQTITRHQIANRDLINHFVDQQQDTPKPTPYYQTERQNLDQTGSMINTFA